MENFSTTSIATILGSAVLAALIAFFSKGREERMTCVAEERRRWRDRLREIASRTSALAEKRNGGDGETMECLRALAADLETRLNPSDSFDRKIVTEMKKVVEWKKSGMDDNAVRSAEKLNGMIACLLKHDWERAKIEAGIPYKHVVAAFALSAVATWTLFNRFFPYGFSAPLQPLAFGLIYCLCLIGLTALWDFFKLLVMEVRKEGDSSHSPAFLTYRLLLCTTIIFLFCCVALYIASAYFLFGQGAVYSFLLAVLLCCCFRYHLHTLFGPRRSDISRCSPMVTSLHEMAWSFLLTPRHTAEETYKIWKSKRKS